MGGNAHSAIGGTQDNYFIVSMEGNENIEIAANADSLYYTLKIISKKATTNKELLKFRDFKKPVYNLFKSVADSLTMPPNQTLAIKQRTMKKLTKEAETVKSKIAATMENSKNISVLMAGLVYNYEANFGRIDGSTIVQYESRLLPFQDILLVKNTLNLSKNVKTNRVNKVIPDVLLRAYSTGSPENFIAKTSIKVIDFWASWCRPCRYANRTELPVLYEKHKKSFSLIGVSIDTDLHKWEAAVKKDSTQWPQYLDEQTILKKTFSIESVSVYLVVDQNNKIIFEANSVFQIDEFLEKIKQIN